MTWATRCPTCATVFRVAADQLRVSEGFVRCGRCDGVFNAQSQLFDLQSGETISVPTPGARPQAANPSEPLQESRLDAGPTFRPEPAEPPADALTSELEAAPQRLARDWPDAGDPEPVWTDEPASPTQPLDAHTEGTEPGLPDEWPAPEDATARMRSLLGAEASPSVAPPESEPYPTGQSLLFGSVTEPPARPSKTTAGFVLSAVLLLVAVPAQWAWLSRDEIRARWPWAEATWQKVCTNCEPVALRRLDGLVVAASSLQPTPQGQAYHLRVRLDHQGPWPVTPPSLDLLLTDREGKPLLRRSLSPAELGVQVQRLVPGDKLEMEATFTVDERLNGYEVGIFQP
ncbi:zinc-ribbon and DUF3426 domain-containing protein [Inhella gelatinilytica]|uniref:Zinc-ribbon domain-containing protein n=1 Tax=Inhella gelatinilytica TaxID=2795030 RepID=A0A931J0P7_9BURK|nr:zinc-ribbon domain-containing protein [Inhella gelatinilytica]